MKKCLCNSLCVFGAIVFVIIGIALTLRCFNWAGDECSRICGDANKDLSSFCECNSTICMIPMILGFAIALFIAGCMIQEPKKRKRRRKK